MSDLNKVKLAGLAFYGEFGKEWFKSETSAIDFILWNLHKGYMSDAFVDTVAKYQSSGQPFMLGEMPVFYDEWEKEQANL